MPARVEKWRRDCTMTKPHWGVLSLPISPCLLQVQAPSGQNKKQNKIKLLKKLCNVHQKLAPRNCWPEEKENHGRLRRLFLIL